MNQDRMSKRVKILHIVLICILAVLVGGLTYIQWEVPCISCYSTGLQRNCFAGIAGALLLNLRFGMQSLYYGLCLLSAILGGIIALNQLCMHGCPESSAFGEPICGLSLYTWSLCFFGFFIFLISGLLSVSKSTRE